MIKRPVAPPEQGQSIARASSGTRHRGTPTDAPLVRETGRIGFLWYGGARHGLARRRRTVPRTRLRALYGSPVPCPRPAGPGGAPRRALDGARPHEGRRPDGGSGSLPGAPEPRRPRRGGGAGRRTGGVRRQARRRRPDVRPRACLPPARAARRRARRRSVAARRADRGRCRARWSPGACAAGRRAGRGGAVRRRSLERRRCRRDRGVPPQAGAPAAAAAVGAAAQAWTPNPILDAIEPDRPVRQVALPPIEEAYPGVRGDGTQTLVFRRPAPSAARAILRVWAPDGTERTIEVDGTPLTLGRSRDNGLVLGDSRVSRHHGRLQARRGTLVYTDLGSTNGSRVNGDPRGRDRARRRRPADPRRHDPRRRDAAGLSGVDGFVLTLWLVRLLFLLSLYVVPVPGRPGRSSATCARRRAGPAELGRLVVVASPRGRAAGGHLVRARRDHDARPRRQQRDRRRRPVRLAPSTPS